TPPTSAASTSSGAGSATTRRTSSCACATASPSRPGGRARLSSGRSPARASPSAGKVVRARAQPERPTAAPGPPPPGRRRARERDAVPPRGAPAPPLRPAGRQVGRGVAAQDEAPLAGPGREAGAGRPPRLRPYLLPLPRQRAGGGRDEPALPAHLRLHQRLPRPGAGRARAAGGRRRLPLGPRVRHVPRRLLLAAARPLVRRARRVRQGAGRGRLGRAGRGA